MEDEIVVIPEGAFSVIPHPQAALVPALPNPGDRTEFYQSLRPFVWVIRFEFLDKRTKTRKWAHQTGFAVGDGLLMTSCHGDWDQLPQLTITGRPLSSGVEYKLKPLKKDVHCDLYLVEVVGDAKDMVYPPFCFGRVEVGEPIMVVGHPLDYPGSGLFGVNLYECGGNSKGFRLKDKNYCQDFPRPDIMMRQRHRTMGHAFNKEFFARFKPTDYLFEKNLIARTPILQISGLMAGKGASGAPAFNLKGQIVGMHLYRCQKYEVLLHSEVLLKFLEEFGPRKKVKGSSVSGAGEGSGVSGAGGGSGVSGAGGGSGVSGAGGGSGVSGAGEGSGVSGAGGGSGVSGAGGGSSKGKESKRPRNF